MIELINLSKRYRKKQALHQTNLRFEDKVIYGLLGRNGAGKTTMLNIITNRIFSTTGEVIVEGEDVVNNDRTLSKIYMTGDANLLDESDKLTTIVKDTAYLQDNFDLEKMTELASIFKIDMKTKFSKLSTGYKTIFKNCLALSTSCPYLIFDEPILGLDAWAREEFYVQLLKLYNEEPRTIIISTHLIDEVANIIERAVILNEGRVIEDDTCENLLSRGYTISGRVTEVDAFVADKRTIGEDAVGALKSVYVLDERPESLPEGLDMTPLSLQKLFIQLTEAESKAE